MRYEYIELLKEIRKDCEGNTVKYAQDINFIRANTKIDSVLNKTHYSFGSNNSSVSDKIDQTLKKADDLAFVLSLIDL